MRWFAGWFGVLVSLSGPVAAAKGKASRRAQPTRELMKELVSIDGALERHIHPALGLLLVDYHDGDYRRVEHLCGKKLRDEMPALRRELEEDSRNWDATEEGPLECDARTLECHYDPGEMGRYEGKYFFKRRPGGALALFAIVRLESGALDRRPHYRYFHAAMRNHGHARCPA